MNLSRHFPHLHPVKFVPFALISLFFLTNFTGILFSTSFAPSVNASTQAGMIPSDIPTSGNAELDLLIFRTAAREGLDPRFVHAVIWQESKYDQRALSPAGARGLMQLMPATARRFGCHDPHDVAANVAAGTKYLGWLLKRFSGNVELALAGYNAGEGSVDKYKGVPPYNETRNYVRKISARYGKTYHPVLSADEARIAFNLFPQENQTSSGVVE